MITYGKSTYEQIIDDVYEDVNDMANLSRKSDESFQVDILRAEEQICKSLTVDDEYDLRIATSVTDYNIQDRPAIEKITNESPMVVWCEGSHELVTNDIIGISFVQVISVNKQFSVTKIDGTRFSLRDFVRIKTIDVSGTPVVVATETDHGWGTGNSITIAETSIVDGSFSITVTGTDTFTIPTSGSGIYSPGKGIASKATTSLGVYISGGRFWKENEIPTYLGQFYRGIRDIAGITRRVEFVNNGTLVNDKDWAIISAGYGSYDAPHEGAHLQKAGRRYISLYPKPVDYGTVKLYGRLKITPTLYYNDPLSAPILLDSDFDETIKAYCRSKAYGFVKNYEMSSKEMRLFFDMMEAYRVNRPEVSTTIVTYT